MSLQLLGEVLSRQLEGGWKQTEKLSVTAGKSS